MNTKILELFEGKSIAIAGFGVEGRAAYELLKDVNCDVTVIDENESIETPDGVGSNLGDNWLDDITSYDVVLRTSGMHPDKLADAQLVTTSTDILLRLYRHQTIALTGTKGKTTTVKLTAELLRSAGVQTELVGNVGRSAWEVLATDIDKDTVVAAELSSFQLSDAQHSPHIAGLLPITDDHLDWHKDGDDYLSSKLNLIRHQTEMDTMIADSRVIAEVNAVEITSANIKPTDKFIEQKPTEVITPAGNIRIADIKLRGQHNLDDIKLAFSLTAEYLHKRGQTLTDHWDSIRRTIIGFEPLEFHIEHIGSINGAEIINDSYGSNPTATLAALNAFEGEKVLILGGHSKGFSFDDLIGSFNETDVSAVVIIGADTEHILELAKLVKKYSAAEVDVVGEQQMNRILNRALAHCAERTTILFSPAHASFDMYTNFNERGRLFTEAVQNHESFRAPS